MLRIDSGIKRARYAEANLIRKGWTGNADATSKQASIIFHDLTKRIEQKKQ
jgi:hypothetical protein